MALSKGVTRKRIPTILLTATAVGAGALALNTNFTTASTSSSNSGTEKDLAASQNTEQQLMDAIRAAQKDVQTALAARALAINKYANATGSATLQVQTRKIPVPKTHAKTGASGGEKENEKEFND